MASTTAGLSSRTAGLREVFLLLIGAGFACQMFNLSELALVAGISAVLVWIAAMVRPARPGAGATTVLGGGLVVTFVWWPDEAISWLAISLMWTGVILLLVGFGQLAWARRRT